MHEASVEVPPAVEELGDELRELGWVSDLLVAGSLATGDYVLGVSDLELVAVVDGAVDAARMTTVAALHARLDKGHGAGLDLGCVYVNGAQLLDPQVLHPTWTHGTMVQRILSGVSRAELARQGFAIFGRPPLDVVAPMSNAQVREAARAELLGAIEKVAVPPWLVDQLRARRQGDDVPSPRLRTALLAWQDARRTVALARTPVAGPRRQSQ